MSPKNINRRSFFRSGVKEILGDFWQSSIGELVNRRLQGLANLLAPQGLEHYVQHTPDLTPALPLEKDTERNTHGQKYFPRPPGSLPNAVDFEAACSRCGDCQQACPYSAIQCHEESGPFIDPNSAACYLCVDFPCIAACQEGALVSLGKDQLPRFGQAYLLPERCINWENEGACNICKKNCPVPDAVIQKQSGLPEFTEHCTGCGLCRAACPTIPVAIRIETEN